MKDCETRKWDYSVVENVGKTERPCRHCHDHVHWEARSPKPPGEFKVRDRVRGKHTRRTGRIVARDEDHWVVDVDNEDALGTWHCIEHV